MDFYHAPGSSSLATYIMLCEAGLAFDLHKVDLFSHTLEDGADYIRINPNGYVPALVLDDGYLLSECAAILDWAAGKTGAQWTNGLARTRHLQLLAFLSTEIHKPFIPLFFLEDKLEQARIRQEVEPRFAWIAGCLEGNYLFGDRFSGADAMLYVMLRWAAMTGLTYPQSLDAFIEHVELRQSVRTALAADGPQPLSTVG
jgi:glutathione S-transferase